MSSDRLRGTKNEQAGRWFAASVHLTQLMRTRPLDGELTRRRLVALYRSGQVMRIPGNLAANGVLALGKP